MPSDDVPVPALPVAVSDVLLWQAARYAPASAAYWDQTQPDVLKQYGGITPESYWDLTVAEHARLVRPISDQLQAWAEWVKESADG